MSNAHPSDRRRVSRAFAQALALAAALAFASGYFGGIVPFFDTLAHFRAHLAALLLLAGLALLVIRPVTAGLAAIILGAFGFFSVYPAMLPAASLASAPGGTARYTLLQMNLRWSATDRTAAIRLIGELSPDVVTCRRRGTSGGRRCNPSRRDIPTGSIAPVLALISMS